MYHLKINRNFIDFFNPYNVRTTTVQISRVITFININQTFIFVSVCVPSFVCGCVILSPSLSIKSFLDYPYISFLFRWFHLLSCSLTTSQINLDHIPSVSIKIPLPFVSVTEVLYHSSIVFRKSVVSDS